MSKCRMGQFLAAAIARIERVFVRSTINVAVSFGS